MQVKLRCGRCSSVLSFWEHSVHLTVASATEASLEVGRTSRLYRNVSAEAGEPHRSCLFHQVFRWAESLLVRTDTLFREHWLCVYQEGR